MDKAQLNKAVKKLPKEPGIYIFSTGGGKNPLYIGKALNLRNRVSNYLKNSDPRLQKMIAESKKLDFIETSSDIEALILESQYIKQFQPAFNIMLRDDKQYGFVAFSEDEYPKIFITHQPSKTESRIMNHESWLSKKSSIHSSKFIIHNSSHIGPFTEVGALRTTLRLLRRIFPYCSCKQLHNNYCLNYHIGKCPGYCCLKNHEYNKREQKEYLKNIQAIREILSGKKKSLIEKFEKDMMTLSKTEKFEEALNLQYKIEKLKRIFENAQIIQRHVTDNDTALKELRNLLKSSSLFSRIECYDIANIHGEHAVGAMVVFDNGHPDKNAYRKFKIHNVTTSQDVALGDTGMLKEVLIRRLNHPEWPYPDLIIVDGGKGQLSAAKEVSSIKNKALRIPIIALTKNERHIGHKIILDNGPSFAKASAGKKEILLSKLPLSVKNLLLQIDSEAHRFAISYYRKLHKNSIR